MKNLIETFLEDSRAKGIGKARINKYEYLMKNIMKFLGKDFSKVSEHDIKMLVIKINEQDWADWTKYDHQIFFKIFWRWYRKEDHPEEIKWLKPKVRNGNNKLPEELLTQEDVKALIEATSNIKYKFIVSFLYESGARISEVLDLKIKHISFEKDKPIARVLLNGKTGMRKIPIYASLPYLRKYLNEAHLDKNNPKAWLFYANQYKMQKLGPNTVRTRLKWMKRKAKVTKAVNPHIFRHSRASYLANFLTEAQMKHFFGWVQSSKMCQVYIHMSGRDVDDAILSKVYGLKEVKQEAEQDKSIKPKVCIKCSYENPSENKFCEKCNFALDVRTIIEQDEKDKKAENEIKQVFQFALEHPKMNFVEIMDKFREEK